MHVDVSRRGITDLNISAAIGSDEDAETVRGVESLDAAQNQLRDLRGLRDTLPALRTLVAPHNLIAGNMQLPPSLTHLDLSHNQLSSIADLLPLRVLRTLVLTDNKIMSLGVLANTHPAPFPALEVLDMSSNWLKSLRGIDRVPSLRRLNVAFNAMTYLADVAPLEQLPQLAEVNLSGNGCVEAADFSGFARRLRPCIVDVTNGVPAATTRRRSAAATSTTGGASANSSQVSAVNASILNASSVSSRASSHRSSHGGASLLHDASMHSGRMRLARVEPAGTVDAHDAIMTERQFALAEQIVADGARVSQLERLLAEERRTNAALEARCRRLEHDAASSRHVAGDEAARIGELRRERDALVDAVQRLTDELERARADAEHARRLARQRAEEFESRTAAAAAEHDAESQHMRVQIEALQAQCALMSRRAAAVMAIHGTRPEATADLQLSAQQAHDERHQHSQSLTPATALPAAAHAHAPAHDGVGHITRVSTASLRQSTSRSYQSDMSARGDGSAAGHLPETEPIAERGRGRSQRTAPRSRSSSSRRSSDTSARFAGRLLEWLGTEPSLTLR